VFDLFGAIVDRPAEIATVITEMTKFRGSIEGGICVRRVEDFIPSSELRYFVIDRRPFGADLSMPIPPIVEDCIGKIDSKFFSIDDME
jgi:hypothetical protein